MKKLIINILLVLTFILPVKINALSTADAKEIIVNKNGSLNLEYKYDDYIINSGDVKLYYIASVTYDYQYSLVGDFQELPIEINGIKEIDEWNILEDTITSYVIADGISETSSAVINNNKVYFEDLKTGLYLVITDTIEAETYSLSFDPFIISVPNLMEDGTWNYDVYSCPKPYLFTPKYDDVTYTIIKEWRDYKQNRPDAIEVDIYKDSELYESISLNSDNNWTYSFVAKDDGSIFTAVERNVPDGYTVSIDKDGTRIVIINTHDEEPPKTVDNIYLYFIILLGSILGLVSTLLVIRKMIIVNEKV